MTAAGDRREDLEALLWREKVPAPLVVEILAAADAYAKAFRPRGPRKPPAPPKPPAVHYGPGGKQAECRPADFSARSWAVTGDSRDVTCEHCRKTPAWQEAAR